MLKPQNYNNIDRNTADHQQQDSSPLNTSGVQANFFSSKNLHSTSRISGGTFDLKAARNSPNNLGTTANGESGGLAHFSNENNLHAATKPTDESFNLHSSVLSS